MDEPRLKGRLGVEFITPIQGCCVDAILKWRPQVIGQKSSCIFCDNMLKTIRAGEVSDSEWTGMMNETKIERDVPSFSVASMWFSKKKFSCASDAQTWCVEHGINSDNVQEDDASYFVEVNRVIADTERVVWAAPGVVSIFGVSKMNTNDMSSAGMLHSYQSADAKDDKKEEACDESETSEEDSEKCEGYSEKALAGFEKSLDDMFAK